jgi:hypothetical protein
MSIVAVTDFPIAAPSGMGGQVLARGLMIVSRSNGQAMPELGSGGSVDSRWLIGLDAAGKPISGAAQASVVSAVNASSRQYTSLEGGQSWLNRVDQPTPGMLFGRPAAAPGYRLDIPSSEGWSLGIDATGPAPVPRAWVRTRPRP